MVYVASDGSVVESAPWSLKRVFSFFSGFVYMIFMFFQTLVSPDMNRHGSGYTRDYRPGPGGPRPATRRLGRPNIGPSVDIPFGGCRSCAR